MIKVSGELPLKESHNPNKLDLEVRAKYQHHRHLEETPCVSTSISVNHALHEIVKIDQHFWPF